jgi:hypothetical protein
MRTWSIEGPQKIGLGDVSSLRVSTVRGSVNVVGTDGPATVEVSQVRGQPLTVRDVDGHVEIGQEHRHGVRDWFSRRNRPGPVDVTVAVPRGCPTELRLVTSQCVVSGLRSRVDARSVSGELTLVGLSGSVNVRTVSGAIEAHGLIGGLRSETVSGEIILVESSGDVYSKSVSGAITVDLDAAVDGDVTLSTVSGDITVRAPEASELQVQFHSTSGQIASAFPELARTDMPGMHMAHGILGAGTGRLWASSTSGHIALLRRGAADQLDDFLDRATDRSADQDDDTPQAADADRKELS